MDKPNGQLGTSPRRNSWFSNISAKFGNNSTQQATSPPGANQSADPIEEAESNDSVPLPVPSSPNHSRMPHVGSRNAVLQPAAKQEGNGPYTPAPPKSSQTGFLGVFRRLSSSPGNALGTGHRLGHGLVARKVLNVDQNRQRCPISELHDAKLRKVSFCVDVEIAPMPRYADDEPVPSKPPVDAAQKKKLAEKSEGDALKHPKAAEEEKETNGTPGQIPPKGPVNDQENNAKPPPQDEIINESTPLPDPEKDTTKKKEKKKKSEEERKARREKKRKLAEANGSIPMEIRYDSSDSSAESFSTSGTPKKTTVPTTNPVRIYRRCCQLRETPILKKITEQLGDPANSSKATGMVNRIDLTGYYMQPGDLITLGDYLAVVPVREVILEDCNLDDESLRVVMAGLLAARQPDLKRRKPKHEVEDQGGVVERLVIKNNKIGPNGWHYLALFVYLCRSLKYLDVSQIHFPRPGSEKQAGRTIAEIFSTALGERLGGSTLELINLGETEPTTVQFGAIIDGVILCGVKRLGLAHNHLDEQGVAHLTKYLAAGKCEGLDLGGNDLGEHLGTIFSAVKETDPLWALSLSGCNLKPASLCKIMPTLSKLSNFRFIDLSRNHDLFQSTPSAVGLLRRYLPHIEPLKRIHLQDVGMTSEQAIALVEILPEVPNLAHINLLENAELVKLADARTEEAQEEACALYASLLAATRLSKSIICVDIEVPSEQSGEIVKAMGKQVVAYTLRNMERIPDKDIGAVIASALNEAGVEKEESKSSGGGYPDVLAHLVGHDVLSRDDSEEEDDTAPDEDYVIGGTGVVKALTCCLKNRGDESRRQFGELVGEFEDGEPIIGPMLPTGGKAKDMSKHLLAGARKIRLRIQPALHKARFTPSDEQNLRKLMFLDETLQGIIKRFEDEFPDTREGAEAESPLVDSAKTSLEELYPTPTTTVDDVAANASDGEDDSKIRPPKALSRTSSVLSKKLAMEEGHALRAGHRFRFGFTQDNLDLLSADSLESDPRQAQLIQEMAEDVGGELLDMVNQKGPVRTFKEDRELVFRCMRATDPELWDKFVESQHKARANIAVSSPNGKNGHVEDDEVAVSD